jgi:Kae1-associated kinase Bud32
MKLIQQGAEAKIFLIRDKIVKDRIPKKYRHPQLDNQIRRRRTKSEAKIINKALEVGINVPKLLADPGSGRMIHMQYIHGDRLSETLNSYPQEKQFQIMQQLGEQVALLHKNNIIHGDLTTSNTILSQDKIYLIDFGLGFISTKQEDKAVDLHLIKQALEAKHFRSPDHLRGQNHQALFDQFLKTYKDKEIIERLKIVEKRGRYKH